MLLKTNATSWKCVTPVSHCVLVSSEAGGRKREDVERVTDVDTIGDDIEAVAVCGDACSCPCLADKTPVRNEGGIAGVGRCATVLVACRDVRSYLHHKISQSGISAHRMLRST